MDLPPDCREHLHLLRPKDVGLFGLMQLHCRGDADPDADLVADAETQGFTDEAIESVEDAEAAVRGVRDREVEDYKVGMEREAAQAKFDAECLEDCKTEEILTLEALERGEISIEDAVEFVDGEYETIDADGFLPADTLSRWLGMREDGTLIGEARTGDVEEKPEGVDWPAMCDPNWQPNDMRDEHGEEEQLPNRFRDEKKWRNMMKRVLQERKGAWPAGVPRGESRGTE